MAEKQAPGEHPNVTAYRKEQEERERAIRSGKVETPAPHPNVAIAEALGTQTHTIDRDALAAYYAGQTRKAGQVQEKADTGRAATLNPQAEAMEQTA